MTERSDPDVLWRYSYASHGADAAWRIRVVIRESAPDSFDAVIEWLAEQGVRQFSAVVSLRMAPAAPMMEIFLPECHAKQAAILALYPHCVSVERVSPDQKPGGPPAAASA